MGFTRKEKSQILKAAELTDEREDGGFTCVNLHVASGISYGSDHTVRENYCDFYLKDAVSVWALDVSMNMHEQRNFRVLLLLLYREVGGLDEVE